LVPSSLSIATPSVIEASTSSVSAPTAAPTQPEASQASGLPGPGATFTGVDEGKKKKKKNAILKMFGKKSKDVSLAVNA
jgi:hypothetical protein